MFLQKKFINYLILNVKKKKIIHSFILIKINKIVSAKQKADQDYTYASSYALR